MVVDNDIHRRSTIGGISFNIWDRKEFTTRFWLCFLSVRNIQMMMTHTENTTCWKKDVSGETRGGRSFALPTTPAMTWCGGRLIRTLTKSSKATAQYCDRLFQSGLGDNYVTHKERVLKRKFGPEFWLIPDVTREYWDDYCLRNNGKLSRVHDPQMGIESLFASFASQSRIDMPDTVLRELEGAALLLTNLAHQRTITGVTTSILLHLRSYTTESVCSNVADFVGSLLQAEEEEAGYDNQGSIDDTPEWLQCLRDLRSNWTLAVNNKAFKSVSKILGICVMTGLCKLSDVEFKMGEFKIFTPTLLDKHSSAVDLIDAVLDTTMFFIESGYMCFKTKSVKPFLVSDHTALELDQEFAEVSRLWDLVRNGNLYKFTKLTDHEFERRLNDLAGNLKNLSVSLKGMDKNIVMDKFRKVLIMQNDYVNVKMACGLRHAPYAIHAWGDSAQGKTTFLEQMIDALLVSQDMPLDPRYRCAYNPSDRYMSSWKSDMLVMVIDDLMNEKVQFCERSPLRAVIDIINNQMYYAVKAELEAKSKCFVEPWLVAISSNNQDMKANLGSYCPSSVQRRVVNHKITAKDKYRKKVGGVCCGVNTALITAEYTDEEGVYNPPPFDDIWQITIEEAIIPKNLEHVAKYSIVEWKGIRMENIDFKTAMQFNIEMFAKHREDQHKIIAAPKIRKDKVVRCPHKGCRHIRGYCPDHEYSILEIEDLDDGNDPQFGKETYTALHELGATAAAMCTPTYTTMFKVDKIASKVLHKAGDQLEKYDFIKLIPTSWFDNTFFEWFVCSMMSDTILERANSLWYTSSAVLALLWWAISIYIPWMAFPLFIAFCYVSCALKKYLHMTVEKYVYEQLKERSDSLTGIVRKHRDSNAAFICKAVCVLGMIYGMIKLYQTWKTMQEEKPEPQGELSPKCEADIKARDKEVNIWSSFTVQPLPKSDDTKCVTTESLCNRVRKNLLYGSITDDEDSYMLNNLFVDRKAVLIPKHYFDSLGDELRIRMSKDNPTHSGEAFNTVVHRKLSILVCDDLYLSYSPSGGDFKNIIDRFPKAAKGDTPFKLLWRTKAGPFKRMDGRGTFCEVQNKVAKFFGIDYDYLSDNTFNGMCGATLVSDVKGAEIVGIHLGGKAGTPHGCACTVTQDQLRSALKQLGELPTVNLGGQSSTFADTLYGKKILTNKEVHKKSPINYLPHGSQIKYYGTCIGATTDKSCVKKMTISDTVDEVCEVPNKWGPPKMNPHWFGWQTCLANMAIQSQPLPVLHLIAAQRDYLRPLLQILEDQSYWKAMRPLTETETICGKNGVKFIDAVKLSTAMGYPLPGNKWAYIIELEPDEQFPNKRMFTLEIMVEIRRCGTLYALGMRAYPPVKACKKDEVLPADKEKCRIFFAAPIVLTFWVRKMFLPLARFLQMNPLVSEVTIGINCHGPEWEQLAEHMETFGKDRVFAGDYSKFDQKVPSQVLSAAFDVLIELAKRCDYSEKDITMMRAISDDVIFAMVAFNGDMISLETNAHISGNSLTAVLNCIMNSLNLRCYYYSKHDDSDNFRDYVKIGTYGDDNKGSVSEERDDFNIKGCAAYLAEYGQEYTMPDKNSKLVEYMHTDDAEFLKRKSVYHDALGLRVGALSEDSIFKSLHMYVKTTTSPSPNEMSAENIDTALLEWFNHGPEIYEQRRQQMKQVAEKCGIIHMVRTLDLTYEDRVENWKDKYRPTPVDSGS